MPAAQHRWSSQHSGTSSPAGSTPEGLERAERRAREITAELAALRQVATLAARESSPDQLFALVAEQVALIFNVPHVRLVRFETDSSVVVGGFSDRDDEPFPTGSRWSLDSPGVTATVRQGGRPAGVEDYAQKTAEIAAVVRDAGMHLSVTCPIVVEGKMWGAMVVLSPRGEPLPEDTESRLAAFTELVATAIANAESRQALGRLAEEQAALRRVAMLVAYEASQKEILDAIAAEIGPLIGIEETRLVRFLDDRSAVTVASSGSSLDFPVGELVPTGTPLARVLETGKSVRVDETDFGDGPVATTVRSMGIRSGVCAPIYVEGRLWGAINIGSRKGLLPPDAESRLAQFTDLLATAIANTESRAEVAGLAAEQASLRRVATLVAQGATAAAVFDAVAVEMEQLLAADAVTRPYASLSRYEPDDGLMVLAHTGPPAATAPVGTHFALTREDVAYKVRATRQAARTENYSENAGPIAELMREMDVRSSVGVPIVVDGKLWGVAGLHWRQAKPPPAETEERMAQFAELLGTAIANAESSEELSASRRRIVAASDDARRRIERDLHDGVQQQLVSLALELGVMKADPPSGDALKEQLASVTEDMGAVLEALVETARGIHPAILSQGGLAAALRALARRSAVPVELQAQIDGPLPDDVEVAAYYVAAEALTNAAKHARASVVHMDVTTGGEHLTLLVRDDGVGGADPGRGSGLVGLRDRVEALGGTIKIDSSAGRGTSVDVTLPIATESDGAIEPVFGPPEGHKSPASTA